MTFVLLQESLRKELSRRIEAGELTGTELARRVGFTQAHISNFLNRKRGLRLSALDRIVRALGLTIYDLLNARELQRFAAVPALSDQECTAVPLVASHVAASSEIIIQDHALSFVRLPNRMLTRLREDPIPPARRSWTRFVAITLKAREAEGMRPRLLPGSLLLIDRHYNALTLYRKGERNIYAVRTPRGLNVGYLEQASSHLILRPHNLESPAEIIPLEPSEEPCDAIVGRVAHVSMEL